MSDDTVSASARGASFLILLQIGSRSITFALNQVLLRFLSPELLAVSVQLELYNTSVLYFARESLRIAGQRRVTGVQAAINLASLALLAGLPLSYGLAKWYLRSDVPNVPYVLTALRVYGLAAIVELLAEPGYIAVQQNMLYKIRASAEAVAVVMKTITTSALVFWAARQEQSLGALPFAVSQTAYALGLLVVYVSQTLRLGSGKEFSLVPRKITAREGDRYFLGFFSRLLLKLAASLYLQSGIKYVLTQGDMYMIAAFASLEDQGAYALSSNYGGLIARMIFQPVEDSSRNMFAKLCSPSNKAKTEAQANDESKPQQKPAEQGLQQARSALCDLLKMYGLMSLVAFALGPTVAPILLKLVAGSRWADSGAGEVLGTYCYYIPLLAINGVTEAFVAATADTKELRRQSIWMGAFSAAFVLSAYVFLKLLNLGGRGLVLANCVNMASRILFNLAFVKSFFGRHGLDFAVLPILPSGVTVATSAFVPSALNLTQGMLADFGLFGDLSRIGAIAAMLGGVLITSEYSFLKDMYRKSR